MKTAFGLLIDYIEAESDCIQEFVQKFFPNGFPEFTVTNRKGFSKKVIIHDVYVDGKLVGDLYYTKKVSVKKTIERIFSYEVKNEN